ncbi:hypothetical protein KAX02_13790 [candidate division WOR-3 bacterium]|nr:hypothetical protein [candidate division WOR-3 bacterium]
MKDIEELTLKELITDRPDLVRAIKSGEDEGTTTSYVEKDEKKRVKRWTEETRDIDGNLLSKRIDSYSHYETDEVDIIILQVYDGKGKLKSEKKVKHFKDGKKPEITESKIKKL